jgi:hypothetical protein
MGEREVTDGLILYTILMSVILFAFGFFYAKYSLLLRVNKSIRKMLKEGKNKDLLGRRTMEFTSDKIICHTEHSDSVSDVKLVEKFREDEYAFYLYTSAIQAYMIPKRVLGKQDKLDLENWVRSLDL